MLKAVKDKIIVEVLKRNRSGGGIIAPTAAVIDPQGYGRVVSIGEDVERIKDGQVLFYNLRGGMDIVVKDKIFKVLKYDEVYGELLDKEVISQLEILELTQPDAISTPPQGMGGTILGAQ